jgi:hypothetical protein
MFSFVTKVLGFDVDKMTAVTLMFEGMTVICSISDLLHNLSCVPMHFVATFCCTSKTGTPEQIKAQENKVYGICAKYGGRNSGEVCPEQFSPKPFFPGHFFFS